MTSTPAPTKKTLKTWQFWLLYTGVIVFAIFCDQLTKFLLEAPLANHRVIPILGDWLTLYWVINNGASFGMFQNRSWLFFILTVVGLPLFIVLLNYSRKRSVVGQIGYSFVTGGAIGNAIDRFMYADTFFDGGVRDFISVDGFAVFNVADSFLVVGVILSCLALLFLDHDSIFYGLLHKKKTDDDAPQSPQL
jgi:signal peptidase II